MLVEQLITSFKTPPKELVLDFDATDNPLPGHQEGRFNHGYYHSYCYLPLYVFRSQQLLCAYLHTSRIDGARHVSAAILKMLVRRLRQQWPGVRIVLRGDSGFCRQRIINYSECAGPHQLGFESKLCLPQVIGALMYEPAIELPPSECPIGTSDKEAQLELLVDRRQGPFRDHLQARKPETLPKGNCGTKSNVTKSTGFIAWPPMATPNCSTYGHPNCPRQDGQIMGFGVGAGDGFLG